MLHLVPDRLKKTISTRGWSLARLSRESGISRRSLYNLLAETEVLNPTFAKVLKTLDVPLEEIVEWRSPTDELIAQSPPSVKKVIMDITVFCQQHDAALVLFGSRARDKRGAKSDWDLGVWLNGKQKSVQQKSSHSLHASIPRWRDEAFPYRVDVVELNQAPDWFRKEVDRDYLILYGEYNELKESSISVAQVLEKIRKL